MIERESVCVPCGLTIIVFLTAFPETSVEVSKSKLVFTRFPDVVDRVGQLPLSDPGQLVSPGWRQRAVEGVLSGALCVKTSQKDNKKSVCTFCRLSLISLITSDYTQRLNPVLLTQSSGQSIVFDPTIQE